MRAIHLAALIPMMGSSALGAWEVTSDVSPMTDAASVTISTPATEILKGTLTKATLMISCSDDTTDLAVVVPGAYFANGSEELFSYRIDQHEQQDRLAVGSNEVVLVRPSPIPVIKQLLVGSRLLVELIPARTYVLAQFDLTGLDTAILPVREACNW